MSSLNDDSITLSDIVAPLWARRRFLLALALAAAVLMFAVSWLIRPQYTAVTRILPPQQSQSSASALLGQLGMLTGVGTKELGLKNPAELYVAIMQSRGVEDNIVRKFGLQSYYRTRYFSDARRKLEKHAKLQAEKSGLISVSFEHRDPNVAARVANAFVEQLYSVNQRLAITEASQRRMFFEKQLEAEKNSLADSEVELRKTQESTGLIQLSGQAELALRTIAQLRAELSAKELQLRSMQSFATSANPDIQRLQEEIATLNQQLSKQERNSSLQQGDVNIPTGKLPRLGLEYVRKLREVKYHESLYEILAKQYEAAKIDEGKSASVVQVVDEAVAPDKKSSPNRMVFTLVGLLCGLSFGCLYLWMQEYRVHNSGLRRPASSSPLEVLPNALAHDDEMTRLR